MYIVQSIRKGLGDRPTLHTLTYNDRRVVIYESYKEAKAHADSLKQLESVLSVYVTELSCES